MEGIISMVVESHLLNLSKIWESLLTPLKFHIYTSTVTARTNRMLALINKSFEYLSTNMLLQLYKSFVRPILEYGNTVWGPMFVLD